MRIKIAKWGNSAAIRLPKAMLELMQVSEGQELDLVMEGDRIGNLRASIGGLIMRVRSLKISICVMCLQQTSWRAKNMRPEVDDLYWIDFSAGLGSKQEGRRPGLILTGQNDHARSGSAFVVPVISRVRDWPTEMRLPDTMVSKGLLLVDQARFVERESSLFGSIEVAPHSVVQNVRSILSLLLSLPQAQAG